MPPPLSFAGGNLHSFSTYHIKRDLAASEAWLKFQRQNRRFYLPVKPNQQQSGPQVRKCDIHSQHVVSVGAPCKAWRMRCAQYTCTTTLHGSAMKSLCG